MSKDSGNVFHHTELGLLPVDWGIRSIKDLQLDISDGNYSSKYPRADEFKSVGIPFIRANNIKGLTIVDDDMRFISEAKHSEITKGHLKDGDVLITNRGEIGNLAIVPARHIGSNINAQIVRINTSGSEVSNRYFAYYLQKDEVKKLLVDLSSGSALKQLPVNRLTTLKVVIPSLQEQTAIANALSDVDALIQELEKLIAKKQAIKTATMQQLLTGRTRLPQFAHHPDGRKKGHKPSELGEIPEDWEFGAIGDSCRTYSGGTPSTSNKNFYGGDIKWITSSDLNQGVIHDVVGRITDAGLSGSSAKLVEADTLLIALYGATAGVCAITRITAAINQAVLAIVPAEHNSEYLFYWFTRHKDVIIETYTQGGQPNLSGDIVRSIKLAFPPVKEQVVIATILSEMDEEIHALDQRLNKTRQIKQGMMQELLTGKTRLKS